MRYEIALVYDPKHPIAFHGVMFAGNTLYSYTHGLGDDIISIIGHRLTSDREKSIMSGTELVSERPKRNLYPSVYAPSPFRRLYGCQNGPESQLGGSLSRAPYAPNTKIVGTRGHGARLYRTGWTRRNAPTSIAHIPETLICTSKFHNMCRWRQ